MEKRKIHYIAAGISLVLLIAGALVFLRLPKVQTIPLNIRVMDAGSCQPIPNAVVTHYQYSDWRIPLFGRVLLDFATVTTDANGDAVFNVPIEGSGTTEAHSSEFPKNAQTPKGFTPDRSVAYYFWLSK
jgi:hypothetical protein